MISLLTSKFSKTAQYAFAVLVVILAWLLREFVNPILGERVPFILFYPAVVLAAWFGGLGPGLLTTALSVFIAWYAFMPPAYSFALSDPTGLTQLSIFLFASAMISFLAQSLHRMTERAQEGERKQHQQSEQFRVTLESIGDAVIATDAQGRITFVNRVAEALTGWTHKEVLGRPLDEVFKIVNEQTREAVENPVFRALEHGSIAGLANHSVLIAKDGKEYPIDDSAAPIHVTETGTTGAVLVFRDITQRRATEHELWESRERLRITLSSIGDAVVVTDAVGRVTYVNPVAENLLGYSLAQAKSRPLGQVFNIVNEFTRRAAENPVERVLREGHIISLANHTLLIRPDGTEVPIDDSAAPIHDDTGAIVGVVLVFRDVTERRRAEKAKATLAAIIESSDDAIISKDLNGRIMTWNASAEQLFGYREQEVIGQPITLIIPHSHLNEETMILQRIRIGERIDHYETVRQAKNGSLLDISLTVSPIRDGLGNIVGASKIARDITRRKLIEAALRQSQERLRQQAQELEQQLIMSGRLVSLGEVTASMAHEFNNPLGIIMGFVEDMLGSTDPADPNYRALQIVDEEAKRCAQIVRDLMEYARPRGTEFCSTSLADVIEKTLQLVENRLYKQKIAVEKAIAPELPRIQADSPQLEQVLVNLYLNAIDAMPEGGKLSVEARMVQTDGTAQMVVVTVADTGSGIDETDLAKIFQPFFTAKKGRGMGLGLPICQRIVKNHGGRIEVKSQQEVGSTFIIYLPLEWRPSTEENS
ncbi:MAG TPA: PAS domain S-box protein [Candidatus Binatia bacterium]